MTSSCSLEPENEYPTIIQRSIYFAANYKSKADFYRGRIAPQTALRQAAFGHSSTKCHSVDSTGQQISDPADYPLAASPCSTCLASWHRPARSSSVIIPYFDCFLFDRSLIDYFAGRRGPCSSRSRATH